MSRCMECKSKNECLEWCGESPEEWYNKAQSLEQQNAELMKDLNWSLNSQRFYIKHWFTDSGLESVREKDARRCDDLLKKYSIQAKKKGEV